MPTFNTTDPKPGFVYDSDTDTWYPLVGIAPGSTITQWVKTAVGGETSVSGTGDNATTLSYTPGTEQVYLNGVLLVRNDDYTATNGTSITGLSPALVVNDVVEVITYNPSNIQITDAVLKTDIAAKGDLIVGNAVDNYAILSAASTNGYILSVNSSTGTGLEWIANDQGDITAVTSGTGISVTNSTGPVPSVAVDTAVVATTNNTLTLSNKTIAATSNTITGVINNTLTTTTGDTIYASAANTPARLGIGTTGQVLTVSGGVPTWATPVSGSITLISEQTLSGASSVTFGSIPGTYKRLLLVWTGIYLSAASGTQWAMRLNNDSTTEIYSYNSISAAGGNAGSAISAANRTSNLFIAENNTSTVLRNTSNGFILIDNYTSTTLFKPYTISFGYQRTGTLDNFVERTEGVYASTSAITSIDLVRTSGTGNLLNVTSTSLRLYGIN